MNSEEGISKNRQASFEACRFLVTRRRFELRTPCLKGSFAEDRVPRPPEGTAEYIENTGFADLLLQLVRLSASKVRPPAYPSEEILRYFKTKVNQQ